MKNYIGLTESLRATVLNLPRVWSPEQPPKAKKLQGKNSCQNKQTNKSQIQTHACNPSSREAEAREPSAEGQRTKASMTEANNLGHRSTGRDNESQC